MTNIRLSVDSHADVLLTIRLLERILHRLGHYLDHLGLLLYGYLGHLAYC